MTIERMNELISKWERQKSEYVERMEKKISDMKHDRDVMLAAQTQRIFAKHKLVPDELNRLKFASREQLKKVLDFINEEIREPEEKQPETAAEEKEEE